MTQILITAPRGCYFPGDCIDLSEADADAFVAVGGAVRVGSADVEALPMVDAGPALVAGVETVADAEVASSDDAHRPGEAVS